MKRKNNLWSYLFTPFHYVAGTRALAIGAGVLLLLSLLGWATYTFFDGVLDVHYGCLTHANPYHKHIAMLLISWASVVTIFYLAARIFSTSSVRLVDMAGTMAMAKAPMIFAALCGFAANLHPCFEIPTNQEDIANMISLLKEHWAWIAASGVIGVACIIWFVALMYNAFSVSGNLKGNKGTAVFIVALLLSEVASKLLIHFIL